MTEMELYWLTRALAAHSIVMGLTVVSGLLFAASLLLTAVSYNCAIDDEDMNKCRVFFKATRMIGVTFCVLLTVLLFVPSKNDILIIKGIPALSNSKVVQELFPKVVDRLIKEVDNRDESQVSSSKR